MSGLSVLNGDSFVEDSKIDTCATCPKLCRSACPVAEVEARETTTPWNLVNFGGFVKRGLVTLEDYGDLPYHCSDCGACTDACLHNNDVPGLISLGRQRLLSAGLAPTKVLELLGNFGVAGNPYGVSLEKALTDIVVELGLSGSKTTNESKFLYQPGCASIKTHPKSVSGFVRVLNTFGIENVKTDERSSHCCGLPLLWSGDIDGFRAHAQRHASRLSKAKGVIVQDPACAHAMKVRYEEVGVKMETQVLHTTDFLAEHIGENRLSRGDSQAEPFAYAECCSLKNGLKAGDKPVELIRQMSGQSPVELPDLSGNTSDCCGASGLLPLTNPATAEDMASAKLLAYKDSKASQLVTFSPRCAAHLKSIAPKENIVDAMELLASR